MLPRLFYSVIYSNLIVCLFAFEPSVPHRFGWCGVGISEARQTSKSKIDATSMHLCLGFVWLVTDLFEMREWIGGVKKLETRNFVKTSSYSVRRYSYMRMTSAAREWLGDAWSVGCYVSNAIMLPLEGRMTRFLTDYERIIRIRRRKCLILYSSSSPIWHACNLLEGRREAKE